MDSPDFMAGAPRVHVHVVRKRGLPGLGDIHIPRQQQRTKGISIQSCSCSHTAMSSDDVGCSKSAEEDEEVTVQGQWSPSLEMRQRSKPLAFPTMRQRIIEPATLLAQLSVVELSASGYHNNCLWFSVQRAIGQVSADGQYTEAAETASDKGRTQIHQELLRALPAAADAHIECTNEEWWAGFSRAKAEKVYRDEGMMCEVHVFAYAALMKRPICVVDTRATAASIRLYRPGYLVNGLDVSMQEAQRLRVTEKQCVWLRLHGKHFTALARVFEC
jgi:hypothetical protein